jgi:hypothetical protein
MDGTRFDAMTRGIAKAGNRRSFLRGLVGGAAALAASRTLAAAATCTPPGPRNFCNFDSECCLNAVCSGGACACGSGFKQCGTSCIASTQTCLICNAGGPIKSCNGTCTDTRTDRANCGFCGHACGLKQSCSNGHCCAPGTIWCDGVCKPLSQCA